MATITYHVMPESLHFPDILVINGGVDDNFVFDDEPMEAEEDPQECCEASKPLSDVLVIKTTICGLTNSWRNKNAGFTTGRRALLKVLET
jgi:hypothetical protein